MNKNMYSKNSKLISKFTVICLAFVVVVLPLTVPTNASAVTSATSLSYNACPDGSDYDTVVVPSAASAGVVYNLRSSWPAGNYYVSIYSPTGLSNAGYAPYVWWNNTNLPANITPNSKRVHGGSTDFILGGSALFSNSPNSQEASLGGKRVYNATHSFGGSLIDVPPGTGAVQTQVANGSRYMTSQVNFPAGGWGTFIVKAIKYPTNRSGDFRANVGSIHFRVCPVNVSQPAYQCSDGLDNDGDGATDYPNDFSCSSPTDNDETNPKSQCQDGQDNDNDNLTDYPQDPGCSSPQDNNEFNQSQQNLSVSCYASPSNPNVNQQVVFNSSVSGGNGNYSYSWTGACNGYSQSCFNSFSGNGTQNIFLQVTSGNQTGNATCSVNVSGNQNISCNSNTDCGSSTYIGSNFCQSNSVYRNFTTYTCNNPGTSQSFCSPSTNAQLQQTCLAGQTCSNGSCSNTGSSYTNVTVMETVRNLSSGNLNWSSTVNTNPSDVVEFRLEVRSNSSQTLNNAILRNVLPNNLYYSDSLTLDGISNSGNIISGINIGSISPYQTRVITYRAQVGPNQNFPFGTTTLGNNQVLLISTDSEFVQPGVTYATVYVSKTGVGGATDVPTGLTNNLLFDSFLLPLILALIGLWALRARIFPFQRDYFTQKELDKKIQAIQRKEA